MGNRQFYPGDPNAREPIAILDPQGDQQQNTTQSIDTPIDPKELSDSVSVRHHQCGIDIVIEH
ncbi:hypothetical protein AL047_28115 [Pseudomonas syringae pv. broussonetiae]|nr:hypothetical protein AL047_28115 [Pseudomonas syringae pv. broussonetiae]